MLNRLDEVTFANHYYKRACETMALQVCVVGLGQIGFPVAQYTLGKGAEVYGYDINSNAVKAAVEASVKATTKWNDIPSVDVYITSVTTTQTAEGGPDLDAVFDVCEKIAAKAKPTALLSIESTIVPGTSRKIFNEIFHGKIRLVHVPHRYWADEPEKHGVNQLRVIGAADEASMTAGLNLYNKILGIPLFQVSTLEAAEMCKIAENSHRYLQIAYAEELKLIAAELGIDFNELRAAMNTKWNVDLPEARQGIGGHCLPKDIRYVMSIAHEKASILQAAAKVDQNYREWLSKNPQSRQKT
jgi:nucleotide sugar dehydrogenase